MPWRVMAIPRIAEEGTAGTLTFSAVLSFKPCSSMNRMISRLNRAAKRKSGLNRVLSEIAADLMPRKAPSVAADTVPE
jgi:hypothetical protein